MRTVYDEGEKNTYLEVRCAPTAVDGNSASQSLIWTSKSTVPTVNGLDIVPTIVGIRMKVRIDEQAYYQTGSSFTFDIRHYKADGINSTHSTFAKISGQQIAVSGKIEGDASPVITKWTDVEFVFNTHTKTGIYRIGDAEGTFGFESYGKILAIRFWADSNATGLYVDDLQVYTCAPQRITQTVTASVVWDDAHDYAGIRPDSAQLTVNGQTATVTAESNWEAEFVVPVFDAACNPMTYTASASADNYQCKENGLVATLSHQPVLPNTSKEGVDTKAYFYNDYEGYLDKNGDVLSDVYNNYYTGANVSQAGQLMYIANNNQNNYLHTQIVEGSDTSYYQANLTGYTGGDYTVSFKLSTTTSYAPAGTYFQYRYGSSGMQTLFKIVDVTSSWTVNSGSYLGGYENSSYQIKSGSWITVHAVFDMSEDGSSDQCLLYINNNQVGTITLPERAADYNASFVRLFIPGEGNVDRTLLIDDFIIYPGTNLLTVDQVNSPGYYYTGQAYEVPDVAAENAWDRNDVELDANILKQAVEVTPVAWPYGIDHDFSAMNSATALYYMVLAVNLDEDVTVDGKSVAEVAAQRISDLVSGGKEPWASVGTAWGHGVVASTMTLAKNTEKIWSQLTEAEKAKVDLLMECLAIAANWGYNTQNDYKTGFAMDFNFDKTANPNIHNAYFTCYLSAAMYFDADGNHDGNELDAKFQAFNYDSYITRLTDAGFTNILYAWEQIGSNMTTDGELYVDDVYVGSGVGVDVSFTYFDKWSGNTYDSTKLTEMFIDRVKHTYSWAVISSYNSPADDSYAYILSGESSPWEGQMGMMREFASGTRSEALYCYLGAANIAPLYANMKLLGYWDYSNSEMLKMDNRIYVGTQDLFFKLQEGYWGYTNSVSYANNMDSITNKGGIYVEDIFNNFHFKNHEQ